MSKTFNFYCDESTHLENDRAPYLVLAYVSSAYNQVKSHHEAITNIKKKHGFNFEIKWSSVSKGQYNFYMELVDYFFSNDLQFRAIFVDKTQIKNDQYGQTYDDFYYKMYYQLIAHKLNHEFNYNVYLDIKDTLSANKVRVLKEKLNFVNFVPNKPIRNIQNIRSNESLLMQLTDFLMGAVNYYNRNLNTVIAKNKIIEKIMQHSNSSLVRSTKKSDDKFNLFFIELK